MVCPVLSTLPKYRFPDPLGQQTKRSDFLFPRRDFSYELCLFVLPGHYLLASLGPFCVFLVLLASRELGLSMLTELSQYSRKIRSRLL